MIGDSETYTALKNQTTYLILTEFAGLELMLNSQKPYSDKLPQKAKAMVLSVVYAKHSDCFFFILQATFIEKGKR